jgi:MoaA/NifB/PqqE/SkfB family radical SAM enzyme
MMAAGDYFNLFEQAETMGVKEISISGGGEPFMYREIGQLLEWLAQSSMRVRIVSNGNYIPESAVSSILAADEIRFSVDSIYPEKYNEMRGLRPTSRLLERTVTNIKNLLKQRDTADQENRNVKISTSLVVGPANVNDLEAYGRFFLGDVGVDSIIVKRDIYGTVTPGLGAETSIEDTVGLLRSMFGEEKVDFRPDMTRQQIGGLACTVSHFKVAFNPYGELFSCCLGSQPQEINGYQFGKFDPHQPNGFMELWDASRPVRSLMLGGVSCTDCNSTDMRLNHDVRVGLGLPQRHTAEVISGEVNAKTQ